MNLYMKQRVFSFADRFTVYDENGNDYYYVEGEVFSWGKKLHVYDLLGKEIAFISQKVFSFLPKYYISIGGAEVAEVVKKFTFFYPSYEVNLTNGNTFTVEGDFFDHEYEVKDNGRFFAGVSKEWFTWGDSYRISVTEGGDPALALSIVLVIDACLEAERD
ncbi:MAG: LURP-one-related family protein [Clostridia bacterium]|nr:LURP-one-related family protein [Clostridia bacterium]